MDSKTYGVKIVALTDGFKNKMNEIKSMTEKSTSQMKQRFNEFKEEFNYGFSGKAEQEIDELTKKVEKLKQEIQEDMALGFDTSSLSSGILLQQYEQQLDRLKNKSSTTGTILGNSFNRARKSIKNFTINLKQAGKEADNFDKNNKKLNSSIGVFDRLAKKVTRYGLALFGIRSIYALVSRASSAYLSQDTELANKLQSVWAGLGAFLAPVIEKIANMLIKLVSYLNIFVKAVTGQDMLKKAGDKATASIKKETGAVKGLNKALAGIDEITNVQDDSATGGDMQIDNPFAQFTGEDQNLPFAEKIKEFGEWIKANKEIVIAGLSGLALALLGVGIAMKTGTFGAFSKTLVGIGIAVVGIVIAIQSFKDYLDLTNKGLQDSEEGWKKFWDIITGIGLAILGVGVLIGSVPVIVTGAVVAIVAVIAKYWKQIREGIITAINWIEEKIKWLFGDTLGDIIMAPFKDAVGIIIHIFDGLFKGVKQIIDGIIKIFKGDFKEGIAQVGKGVANILIGILNGLISSLNLFLVPFRSIIVLIGKAMGKNLSMGNVKLSTVPLLNVGTNYVPEDQLAYIHKGEAVVPKKFNSAEYFNQGTNSDDVKELLNETNRLLARIEEKDNNTYLDGKEIANSTISHIKKQNRILGRSVI